MPATARARGQVPAFRGCRHEVVEAVELHRRDLLDVHPDPARRRGGHEDDTACGEADRCTPAAGRSPEPSSGTGLPWGAAAPVRPQVRHCRPTRTRSGSAPLGPSATVRSNQDAVAERRRSTARW
ncbi:hypothetical protein GTQ99_20980 [Kineococcus sp. T13]|nr:hypothetical protein [Kineococcus vitellinus]